jgi:5'(3')-deoxyribonucleotidase
MKSTDLVCGASYEWDHEIANLVVHTMGDIHHFAHERELGGPFDSPELIAEIRKHRPTEAHETRCRTGDLGVMSIDDGLLKVTWLDGSLAFFTRDALIGMNPERLAYFDAHYVPPLKLHEFISVEEPKRRGRFLINGTRVEARHNDGACTNEQTLPFEDVKIGNHRMKYACVQKYIPNAERMIAWCREQPEYLAWLKEQEAPPKLESMTAEEVHNIYVATPGTSAAALVAAKVYHAREQAIFASHPNVVTFDCGEIGFMGNGGKILTRSHELQKSNRYLGDDTDNWHWPYYGLKITDPAQRKKVRAWMRGQR